MTRQIDDLVNYRGKEYSLADRAVSRLAVPQGYSRKERSTACYRGYYYVYEVTEKLLFAIQMDGSRGLVDVTGAMLLAADYIFDLWGMVTPDAYKYREVHEVVFQDGKLVEEHDRSGKVAEFRQMLSACDNRAGSAASIDEVAHWVKRSFSREYEEFVRDYKRTELESRVRGRKCAVCGCVIDLFRLCEVPNTRRCLPCQIAFETRE
jgi:RNA polymerase-binding transcription factor DksA